jgi:ribonuclease HI
MDQVTIYSDGGADPNPGIGGWAAILRFGRREKVLTGSHPQTTNNRMELQAAIAALEALSRPCHVDFYTDSQYVRQGISQWIEGWARRGWRSQSGQDIANVDLWKRLWELSQEHEIEWHWVRGHSGNRYNERVDELARAARLAITPAVELGEDVPRLYIRASVSGNPGPGGWGVVLEEGDETEQFSGSEPSTTNNRMELRAAIEALQLLPPTQPVELFTTSDYVYQGATSWIDGWRKRSWQKQGGQPVANADLWQELDRLLQARTVRWINAKGKGEAMPLGLVEAGRLAAGARDLA